MDLQGEACYQALEAPQSSENSTFQSKSCAEKLGGSSAALDCSIMPGFQCFLENQNHIQNC